MRDVMCDDTWCNDIITTITQYSPPGQNVPLGDGDPFSDAAHLNFQVWDILSQLSHLKIARYKISWPEC